MVAKSKPATQMIRKPLTEAEIQQVNDRLNVCAGTVQWFSVVHQEMFQLRVRSYEQAAKLVSTLDFGRTCHVRIVNDLHQVLHSFH